MPRYWTKAPRGKSVKELTQYLATAEARAYDDDWMVRADGRKDAEVIKAALKVAVKREGKESNPGIPKGQWIKASAVKISGGRLLIKK